MSNKQLFRGFLIITFIVGLVFLGQFLYAMFFGGMGTFEVKTEWQPELLFLNSVIGAGLIGGSVFGLIKTEPKDK